MQLQLEIWKLRRRIEAAILTKLRTDRKMGVRIHGTGKRNLRGHDKQRGWKLGVASRRVKPMTTVRPQLCACEAPARPRGARDEWSFGESERLPCAPLLSLRSINLAAKCILLAVTVVLLLELPTAG